MDRLQQRAVLKGFVPGLFHASELLKTPGVLCLHALYLDVDRVSN